MKHQEILEAFGDIHVCVIGDVMIDEYIMGKVERMSPEAPVPVVDVVQIDKRLGGAANVALNCYSLGAKVTLASVIGNDDHGVVFENLLEQCGIDGRLIQKSDDRQTTCKQRVISKSQQMLRIDYETKSELNTAEEHAFIDKVLRFLQIQSPDIVIIEDYNKGVLKENVIHKILAHCKALRIPVAVDPKEDNFFAYKGVAIFKPNLKELKDAFEMNTVMPAQTVLDMMHERLQERLLHENSLITLSEHGVYVHDKEGSSIFPTFQRNISDVSGAGDTVIAVASLVYAVTKDIRLAAQWSNLAGGLVCEQSGVVPIAKEQLEREVAKQGLS